MLSATSSTYSQVGVSELNATLAALASGVKSPGAAEDSLQPADLIAAESLNAELAALDSRMQSAQRADSVAAVTEGALSAMGEMAIRARSLAVSLANTGGYSEAELDAMRMEMRSLIDSMDRTASSAGFAGRALFDGNMTLNVGGAELNIPAVSAAQLGRTEIDGQVYSLSSLLSADALFDPNTPMDILQAASSQINTMRGEVGAFRADVIASMKNSLNEMFANTAQAKSVIVDTDYAVQAANLFRERTLSQVQIKAAGLTMQLTTSARDLLMQLVE